MAEGIRPTATQRERNPHMSINTITVPASDSQQVTTNNSPGDLAALQAAVGGYIETVGTGNICIYLDEEGKLKNLPVNTRATKLAHRIKAISDRDVIVGTAVITGINNDTGEPADAPQAALTYLTAINT